MTDRAPLQARPEYEALRVYAPGADTPCSIDLSDNTNRWGISPAAASAIQAFDPAALTRYPGAYAADLKDAIAARLGVDSAMIVTGAGSDGVLEPAIRAFSTPGARMALADPTFVMAAPFGLMNGVAPVAIPLLGDYDVDASAMLETNSRITYLCSPNNPTGTLISRAALERVVAGAAGLVIIDEAYAEFASSDALDVARASDRVLLVRTFSKAFGLAGLRIGYGIGAPSLVAAVEKARGPYTVGALSEQAGIAAMRERDWMPARVRDAVAALHFLHDGLRGLGLVPAPSEANFAFIPVPNATRVARSMAERGIRVRGFANIPLVNAELRASGGEALRITVAPVPVLEQVLEILGGVIESGVVS